LDQVRLAAAVRADDPGQAGFVGPNGRSEEHTAVLQSLTNFVLLLLLGIIMRLRMFLLLITFLKASHSFTNRLLVICKNAYLFATMIITDLSSSPTRRSSDLSTRFDLPQPFGPTPPVRPGSSART